MKGKLFVEKESFSQLFITKFSFFPLFIQTSRCYIDGTITEITVTFIFRKNDWCIIFCLDVGNSTHPQNYAVSISLLTHLVSFHAEIRSCACAGASTLWHAYVGSRRLVCTTYRFREEREEEGDRRYRLKSRTARRQRVHAIDRPSFIGMCIAILPQFRRTPFGTPFSAARRRQSDIRYRATITPLSHHGLFIFLLSRSV